MRSFIFVIGLIAGAGGAFAANITWTSSPATSEAEVNNAGLPVWAYAFNSVETAPVIANGVTFTRLNTGGGGGPMFDSNAMTPGFERFGATSYGEFSDDFYLGPDPALNQLLDGLTWGGTRDFQLNGLTPGAIYTVQIFSSDDRSTQANRVLDLDSSWATVNGGRQVENVDYTAGGAWVDPAGRFKIFTGTFTADATTQQILAALIEPPGTGDGAGQIDLNAIQLRLIPEPAGAAMLGLAAIAALARRRRAAGK